MNKLIIIGASGHGKVVADIADKNGYEEIYFLDDNDSQKDCAGFPVIGKLAEISKYEDCDFVVAIGNSKIRKKITEKIQGYNIVSLIHPNAIISRRVSIGRGTVVMAGAVINSDTKIGESCIVNTGATVDHDCSISDYCHISVGTHIAGTVSIGLGTWIGAGAVVSNNLKIASDSFIGAGGVVIKDIFESGTYVGNPVRRINKLEI
ncbi:acetyltransferase [Neisseria iguanae]|uniref:Acetyltransferase n=1 Tax=Neisseria iguanae TaxID=90242 RepID=A0A2P7U2Q5_9NEIS|nr:acetyltransferase [Neisseria iguanae]PSJ81258.1 acetyltransferase [Neisseria iguanae]